MKRALGSIAGIWSTVMSSWLEWYSHWTFLIFPICIILIFLNPFLSLPSIPRRLSSDVPPNPFLLLRLILWGKTGHNKDKRGQTRPKRAKWGQMGPNGVNQGQREQIWAHWFKQGTMGPNGAELGQTEPKGAKRSQKGPNRAKWGQTVPNRAKWSLLGPTRLNRAKLGQLGQMGVNRAKRG